MPSINTSSLPPCRDEGDSLGRVTVPAHALYGAQTQRALVNFEQLREPVAHHREFLRAFGEIKLAYARRNASLWPESIGTAVIAACGELIAGELDPHFPISMLQGGAGTATHMNVNEVIANRALQRLQLPPASYQVIHPNDHINLGQSTNDVYPCALRIALIRLNKRLCSEIDPLIASLQSVAARCEQHQKLGRTQLQDAVPMHAHAEVLAWRDALMAARDHLLAVSEPLNCLNLGGTAIGSGLNSGDMTGVFGSLVAITGLNLTPAQNCYRASWDCGDLLSLASAQKRLGLCMSKIASDLRLLTSGPKGGLNEYHLPARAPGSSIMPGKVNPVIAEFINQVGFDCSGSEHAVALACEQGQLQLNAFLPLIAHHLLTNAQTLSHAARLFRTHAIEGLRFNPEAAIATLNRSHAKATAWVPRLGYSAVVKLLEQAEQRGCDIDTLAQALTE